jgi:hypothetical protein
VFLDFCKHILLAHLLLVFEQHMLVEEQVVSLLNSLSAVTEPHTGFLKTLFRLMAFSLAGFTPMHIMAEIAIDLREDLKWPTIVAVALIELAVMLVKILIFELRLSRGTSY